MELGMQTESTPFAFRQLWTCIMISIKAESLGPTVMKETPVSEPPLQTTTTSPRRPPLAATAQVIKKIKSREKKKKRTEEEKLPSHRKFGSYWMSLGLTELQIN